MLPSDWCVMLGRTGCVGGRRERGLSPGSGTSVKDAIMST
jgi:hypothetical protein